MRGFGGGRLPSLVLLMGMMLALVSCGAPTGVSSVPTPAAVAAREESGALVPGERQPAPNNDSRSVATASARLQSSPERESAKQTTQPDAAAETDEVASTLLAINAALAAELQGQLDETVAANEIAGVAMAVSLPGRALWTGASGLADTRQNLALTPDTPFYIGSLSKLFLAVVTLQLVEEGLLDLDAPVATWFPDLVPAAERMTVRQLLNHTSGLYDYLDNQLISRVAREPQRIWVPEELLAYAVEQGAYFDPGQPGRWRYSNTNYVLLGMIVEQVAGASLAQEIRQRVIDPLALRQTSFAPDEPPPAPVALGYVNGNAWPEPHMSFVRGSASVVSTVGDLQRLARALFAGELLEPESFTTMQTFVNANDSFGMPYLEYGLGLMRNPLDVGPDPSGAARPAELVTALGHIGGVNGYRAALWYLPASDTVIVVGFNEATVDPVLLPTRVLNALLIAEGR
jgi:D-alanyl-D-alanine carboxypeptidase